MTNPPRKTKNSNKTSQTSINVYTTPSAAQLRQKSVENEAQSSKDTPHVEGHEDTKQEDTQHHNMEKETQVEEEVQKETENKEPEVKKESRKQDPTQAELDAMTKPSNLTLNPFQQLGERSDKKQQEELTQHQEEKEDNIMAKETTTSKEADQANSSGKDPQTISQDKQEQNDKIRSKSKNRPTSTSAPALKFKRVNHSSSNRRTCARQNSDPIDEDCSRDRTPDRNNRTQITNLYYSRVTIKVTIEASEDPQEAVLSAFNDYVKELHQVDSMLTIHPWKAKAAVPIITQSAPDDFPESFTRLTRYLHRVFLPQKERNATLYPQMYIGHDEEYDEIRESIQPWLSSTKQGIYYNMLQVDDAVDMGWLCYSTREMDAGALADEIMETINVPIGLRWKNINTGTRNTTAQNQTKALIVEVSSKNRWNCMTKLLRLYSRSMKPAQQYPNGIRLRFVKMKKDCINKAEKDKMDKLRHRQKEFLEAIQSTSTYEIIQLDYAPSDSDLPTLRQMIMSLPSKADPKAPLFHCVDLDWRQDGYVFQYSPKHVDEAETTINTLLPLLKYKFPAADVEGNFTPEAEMRCLSMTWDEERQMIVDNNCEVETIDFAEEEALVGFEFDTAALDDLQRPKQKDVMPNDNDSISTIRPAQAPNSTARKQSTSESSTHPKEQSSRSQDASSVTSNTTSMSDITTLEARITGLASQVASNQQKHDRQLNEILEAIRNAATIEQQYFQQTNEEASSSLNSGKPP